MGQHQRLCAGPLRGFGGGLRRRVVVQNIMGDGGQRVLAASLCRAGQHADEFRLQRFGNNQVCAPGQTVEAGRTGRVQIAADDDRAAAIVEAIGHGRAGRVMIDRNGAHGQPVRVEQGDGPAIGGQVEGAGRQATAGRRGDGLAVMGGAITPVEPVGGIHSLHDGPDPGRSPGLQRRLACAADPGLQGQRPQIADMVGMIMGDEDGIDGAGGNAHQHQIAGRSGAAVDNEDMLCGNNGGAGLGASRVGQGRARAAKSDMQPVGQAVAPVQTQPGLDLPRIGPPAQLRRCQSGRDQQAGGDCHDKDEGDGDTFHAVSPASRARASSTTHSLS